MKYTTQHWSLYHSLQGVCRHIILPTAFVIHHILQGHHGKLPSAIGFIYYIIYYIIKPETIEAAICPCVLPAKSLPLAALPFVLASPHGALVNHELLLNPAQQHSLFFRPPARCCSFCHYHCCAKSVFIPCVSSGPGGSHAVCCIWRCAYLTELQRKLQRRPFPLDGAPCLQPTAGVPGVPKQSGCSLLFSPHKRGNTAFRTLHVGFIHCTKLQVPAVNFAVTSALLPASMSAGFSSSLACIMRLADHKQIAADLWSGGRGGVD